MLGRVASASLRQTRKISTTAVARKDLVQDLYIREIKSYKPAPAVKDAHVGAVKDFAAPSAPKAPELPSNFAAELAAYDAANPDLADAPAAGAVATHAHADEGSVSGAPAFLAFLEADAEKPHHAEH